MPIERYRLFVRLTLIFSCFGGGNLLVGVQPWVGTSFSLFLQWRIIDVIPNSGESSEFGSVSEFQTLTFGSHVTVELYTSHRSAQPHERYFRWCSNTETQDFLSSFLNQESSFLIQSINQNIRITIHYCSNSNTTLSMTS